MSEGFRWYVPLAKVAAQDDGTVIVTGPVSSEAVDSETEIVDFEALKAAAADYMQFANVREMHDDTKAVGTTLNLDIDEIARKIVATVHVVDPGAVAKVLAGVYKGFSIGGRKLAWEMRKGIRHLTKLWWNELSLVDRPSAPGAVFSLAKRDFTGDDNPAITVDEPANVAATVPATHDGQLNESEGLNKMAGAEGLPDAAGITNTGDDTQGDQTKAQDQAAADAANPAAKKSAKVGKKARKTARDYMAKVAVLAKGNKTLKYLGDAVEEIVCAIAEEASEGDTDGVASLQSLLTSTVKLMSAEAAEGEPDDEPDVLLPEMDGDMAMAYAVQADDLHKAAAKRERKALRKELRAEPIPFDAIAEALTKRDTRERVVKMIEALAPGTATPSPTDGGPAQPATTEPEPLAKASSAIDTLIAKVNEADRVTPADLAKVKGEIVEALERAKDELTKSIAAQPVGGGPLAVPDLSRFGADAQQGSEEQVLAKAIRGIDDPIGREALGKYAAAQQIKEQFSAGR